MSLTPVYIDNSSATGMNLVICRSFIGIFHYKVAWILSKVSLLDPGLATTAKTVLENGWDIKPKNLRDGTQGVDCEYLDLKRPDKA